jgi:hypothetical protein
MKRPDFVKAEDIARWDNNIDNDARMPPGVAAIAIIREVCYSGLWLAESLDKLKCPRDRITQIQFTAGRYCFGRDPWVATQEILEAYKNGQIEFEEEPTDADA